VDVIISTTLVCALLGTAIPTSSFNIVFILIHSIVYRIAIGCVLG
jgi:hypothetical protein